MQEIRISQLVKDTGLSSATLRYYEQEGLISSIGRAGLQRVYHISVIQRLKLIGLGKKAGFSLNDIKTMLENNNNPVDKTKLVLKADEIDRMIKELDLLRHTLRHVANCPYDNPLDCHNFQSLLDKVKF